MTDKPIAHQMTELISPWPMAGDDSMDKAMRLALSRRLSDKSYAQVVAFVEFQRRLCNQQFDNLLEQLAMFRESFLETMDEAEKLHADEVETTQHSEATPAG